MKIGVGRNGNPTRRTWFFLEFNMMTVVSRNDSYTPEEDTALQAILISAFLHFSCSSADVLTHKGRSDT